MDDKDRAQAMLLAEEEINRVCTRAVCGTHASVRAAFVPIFMTYDRRFHTYFTKKVTFEGSHKDFNLIRFHIRYGMRRSDCMETSAFSDVI